MSLSLGICEIYTPEFHGYVENKTSTNIKGNYIVSYLLKNVEFFDKSYLDTLYCIKMSWRHAMLNGMFKHNYKHNIIANFTEWLKKDNIVKVEIIQYKTLEGGEIIGIIKTFWLRIFQKIFKKYYYNKKKRIMLAKTPNAQHYRSLSGKYPK